MTARAKWTLLVVLAVVWGALLVKLSTAPKPQQVPLTYISGQSASRESSRNDAQSALKVKLDLLTANRQQAEKYFGAPRNVFAPLKRYEPKVAVTASVAKESRATQIEPSATPPSVPVPPTPVTLSPPPLPTPDELAKQAGLKELGQYRYLGFLSRGGRLDEAFLSKGKELHIVKTGETIEQRVIVKSITPTAVTLQETLSRVEQTVALLPEKQ